MREQYMKPVIIFERFSLAQTIAYDCGDSHSGTLGESNHYNEYTCEWDMGGATYFFVQEGGRCDDGPEDPEEEWEGEGLCYNGPSGGTSLFSS